MTVKFSRTAGNQYYSAPPDAAFSMPAPPGPPADWCWGFIATFDGTIVGSARQSVLSTGVHGANAAGAFNITFFENASGGTSDNGRLGVYLNTLANPSIRSAVIAAGETWAYFLQNVGSTITLYRCPILGTLPANDSAVITEGSASRAAALPGPLGLAIGARADADPTRFCDHSIGRVWRVDGALTKLEMAKLAYGMEIKDIGKSPLFYTPLDTADDFANEGTSSVAFTKHGAPTTSLVQPAFGYSGAPPASTAPSITNAPVISGTPTAGSSVGYTPGAVTGTAPITRTQQWSLDGVDVLEATNATFTPSNADVGKLLRVRQIETNNVSPPATSTSDPVSVAAAGSSNDTLTAAPMLAESILQRENGAKTITVSGIYSGTAPAAIQYQVRNEDGSIKKAWTAITGAVIADEVWAGTAVMPEGGMYRIEYRSRDSGGVTLASQALMPELFGVGDLYLCAGSSSSVRWFTTGSGGMAAAANVREYENEAGGWRKFLAGGAIRIANALAAQAGVPVGLIACGVNGTTLQTWATTASNYKTAIAEVGGKLAGAIITVGANDADALKGTGSFVTSAQSHLNKMNTLAGNVRTETSQPNLPIFWSGMNRRPGTATDAASDFVHAAENAFGDQPNCYHLQMLDLEVSNDNLHLTTAGTVIQCDRIAYVMTNVIGGSGYKRGPKISSASYLGDTIDVSVNHRNGDNIVMSSAMPGIAVIDDNGSPTMTGSIKVGANVFRSTYNRALINPKVAYLLGAAPPVSSQILDNGTVPLPIHAMPGWMNALLKDDNSEPPDETDPPTEGTIDATKVPDERRVIFQGSKRVVSFQGSKRKVSF